MNLEEIKKRAEEMKKPDPLYFSTYGVWAADTILALVAEVERLQTGLGVAGEFIDRNDKLTAANKIMREGLEFYCKDHFYQGSSHGCTPSIMQEDHGQFAVFKLAEADEVLK